MQVPSAKSLADRAVVKPEGKSGNGSPKPGGSRTEGQYGVPKNVEWWSKDKPDAVRVGGKPTELSFWKAVDLKCDLASTQVTTGILDRIICSQG